jgi:hypothetical protein
MWKVHSAVVIVAGTALVLGLFGADLIAGTILDRGLGSLDIALQGLLSYPTLGAFGFGILFAYAIYGLWLSSRYYELTRWLIRLTDLWSEGVAIRTDGLALATDSQVTAWVERRYTGWHNRVVDTLELVAPVDARIFATTPERRDETGAPAQPDTPGLNFRSPFHRMNVLALSQELDKLKQIVERHQAQVSPLAMALILRLQKIQGGNFGNVLRAREIDAP